MLSVVRKFKEACNWVLGSLSFFQKRKIGVFVKKKTGVKVDRLFLSIDKIIGWNLLCVNEVSFLAICFVPCSVSYKQIFLSYLSPILSLTSVKQHRFHALTLTDNTTCESIYIDGKR